MTTEPKPNVRYTRFGALTGGRYLAAALVVWHHLGPTLPPNLSWLQQAKENVGPGAVTFFFVLSGFVLAHSNVDRHGTLKKHLSAFYLARVARIYPTYLLAWAIVAPFTVFDLVQKHGYTAMTLARVVVYAAASAVLLQAWTPFTAVSWNGPGWSLSVEALFYLAFPFLTFLLIARPAAFWTWTAGAWFLAWLPMLALFMFLGERPAALAHMAAEFNPLLRVPEFALGILLEGFRRRMPPDRDPIAPGLLIAVTAAGMALSLTQTTGWHFKLSWPVLVVVMIYLLTFKSGPAAVLSSPPVVALGNASYTVYIMHIALFSVYELISGVRELTSGPEFLLYLAVLTGFSIAVHRWFEQPLNDLVIDRVGSRLERRELRFSAEAGGRRGLPTDEAAPMGTKV